MSIIYNTLERLEKEGLTQPESFGQSNFLDIGGTSTREARGKGLTVKWIVPVLIMVSAAASLAVWYDRDSVWAPQDLQANGAESTTKFLPQSEKQLSAATIVDQQTVESQAVELQTEPQIIETPESKEPIESEEPMEVALQTKSAEITVEEGDKGFSTSETLKGGKVDKTPVLATEEPATETTVEPDAELQTTPSQKAVSVSPTPSVVPGSGSVAATDVAKQSVEPGVVEQALEQARLALSYGRYLHALSILNKLSPIPEERADFWFIKGSVHLGLGELDQAEEAFESAQQLLPDQAQIAVQLAIIKQEKGEHEKALKILNKAAENNPNVPEIFLNQGYSQQALGAIHDAEYSFRIFMRMTEGRSVYADQRLAIKHWLSQVSFRDE